MTHTNEPYTNVWTFCVIRSPSNVHISCTVLYRSSKWSPSFSQQRLAGLTIHLQRLSIDTDSEVADDTLELFKSLRLELHYFIHSLRSDTEIEAREVGVVRRPVGLGSVGHQSVSELGWQELHNLGGDMA